MSFQLFHGVQNEELGKVLLRCFPHSIEYVLRLKGADLAVTPVRCPAFMEHSPSSCWGSFMLACLTLMCHQAIVSFGY